MTLGAAIKSCFNNYATFSGRASRSEYWFFVLFYLLVLLGLFLLAAPLGTRFIMVLCVLFMFGVFLPHLAVSVRRLHDLDASGLWYLLVIVPFGSFGLLIWFCFKGTQGENRFGPDPFGPSLEVFD